MSSLVPGRSSKTRLGRATTSRPSKLNTRLKDIEDQLVANTAEYKELLRNSSDMKKDAKELAELRAGQQRQEEAAPEPVNPFIFAQTVIEVTRTHMIHFIDARLRNIEVSCQGSWVVYKF